MRSDRAIRFLIRDGAGQFIGAFDDVFRCDGTTIIRTPPYTAVANAYAERWVGTARRELCDRTLIWNRPQLEELLRDYVQHYNTHRPHRSLGQGTPNGAEVVAYRPGRMIRRHTACSGPISQYRQALMVTSGARHPVCRVPGRIEHIRTCHSVVACRLPRRDPPDPGWCVRVGSLSSRSAVLPMGRSLVR